MVEIFSRVKQHRFFFSIRMQLISSSSWIGHLFSKSHQQGTLHLNDLYDLPIDYQSSQLTNKLEEAWFDEKKTRQDNASLFRATCRTVRYKPFLIGAWIIPLVNSFARN